LSETQPEHEERATQDPAVELPFQLDKLPISGDFTFLVVWRSGRKLDRGSVKVSDDMSTFLRQAASDTIAEIRRRELEIYSSHMELDVGQCLVDGTQNLVADAGLAEILLPDDAVPALAMKNFDRSTHGSMPSSLVVMQIASHLERRVTVMSVNGRLLSSVPVLA
jgi:hypothetical protein